MAGPLSVSTSLNGTKLTITGDIVGGAYCPQVGNSGELLSFFQLHVQFPLLPAASLDQYSVCLSIMDRSRAFGHRSCDPDSCQLQRLIRRAQLPQLRQLCLHLERRHRRYHSSDLSTPFFFLFELLSFVTRLPALLFLLLYSELRFSLSHESKSEGGEAHLQLVA